MMSVGSNFLCGQLDVHTELPTSPPSTCNHLSLTPLLVDVIDGWPLTIFPSKLCACTQVVRRAHTRKLGVHINVPSKNAFCTYFIHTIPKSVTMEGESLLKIKYIYTK